ncbi:MAG: AAA family ATPase [Actinobacteria bacterium]|nr:AAA family ATPase [Actinomycetota bacterium]
MSTAPLDVPSPSLVLLVGVAGCGKSTFAARWFVETEVVSSDRCRALICDDPGDQSVTADAFSLLRTLIDRRLRHRRLTVVDATNVKRRDRRRVIGIAEAHGVPAVAVVLDLPLDVCRERDIARPHPVGPEVQDRQFRDLVRTRGQLDDEGYVRVHHITDPDELVTRPVVRVPVDGPAAEA